jgi:hypothetical protein
MDLLRHVFHFCVTSAPNLSLTGGKGGVGKSESVALLQGTL